MNLQHPATNRRGNSNLFPEHYFTDSKHSFDPATGCHLVKVYSGDCYVSANPGDVLSTILGSCVSACVRDPIAGVGGMNHFLLPGEDMEVSELSDAARYGVYAMESLINGILNMGGRKDRLEIKVFGGGNVTNTSIRIGSKNAAFIRDFVRREGFRIHSEDLEGDLPRRINYFPVSGKVMMRKLSRREDLRVVEEETRYTRIITSKPVEGAIDLF